MKKEVIDIKKNFFLNQYFSAENEMKQILYLKIQ